MQNHRVMSLELKESTAVSAQRKLDLYVPGGTIRTENATRMLAQLEKSTEIPKLSNAAK